MLKPEAHGSRMFDYLSISIIYTCCITCTLLVYYTDIDISLVGPVFQSCAKLLVPPIHFALIM